MDSLTEFDWSELAVAPIAVLADDGTPMAEFIDAAIVLRSTMLARGTLESVQFSAKIRTYGFFSTGLRFVLVFRASVNENNRELGRSSITEIDIPGCAGTRS